MTQEGYLEALRSGAQMNFADLIELIDKNYNYTPAIDNEIADILVCITFRVVKNALVVFTKTM
jgi:hypothetical protein